MNKNVKLDKQKERTADISGLSHDGRGIALIDKKTTFIEGALPAEKVAYRLMRQHTHFNEGKSISILEPSSERQHPPCRHFGVCGGCNLQHMSMAQQLAFKESVLLDQLNHFGKVKPEAILPALSAETVGYRRKARLGVKFVHKKNKVLVGFREKASRYLADLEQCIVLHPKIGEHLTTFSELIASLEGYQTIPQIEIAVGDDEAALVFRHLNPLSEVDQQKLKQFGEQHHYHIYLQPNPPLPLTHLWPPPPAQDRLAYTLPDHEVQFLFHPLDFTQINLTMNRLMVNQALQLLNLNSQDTLLDLFCGIGNFSLPAARYVRHVTGVEGEADMIERAKMNAHHNGITNTDFYAANLMDTTLQTAWIKPYDKILLDPPRAGAKEILAYISQLSAKTIVYISCNPATLSRDAGFLVHQSHYQLVQAGIINMFPHTAHIEAMAVFKK